MNGYAPITSLVAKRVRHDCAETHQSIETVVGAAAADRLTRLVHEASNVSPCLSQPIREHHGCVGSVAGLDRLKANVQQLEPDDAGSKEADYGSRGGAASADLHFDAAGRPGSGTAKRTVTSGAY